MAMRFGRCGNFGACTKADTKEKQPMPLGATDAVCAECGKPLVALDQARRPFPVVPIVAIILVLAVAAFALSRFTGSGTKSAPVAATSTAPKAAVSTAPAIAASPAGSPTGR